MNVAVVTPTYWPEVRRGAERVAHEVAAGLAARGHAVRIVTTHPAATARTAEDGVEVVRLRRLPGESRLRRRLFEDHLTAILPTRRELSRNPPDIALALQAPVAHGLGVPTVFAHMGIPHRAATVNRRARLDLTLRAFGEAAAVTVLSRHAREVLLAHFGVDATVIPPPVDTRRFTPGGTRSENPTVVCAADAREPRKRVGLLVDAMEIVRRSEPRAELLLDARTASAVPHSDALRPIAMDELPAVYRSAWVSALPSWGEAFGLVLAEAMACGTPVVGSDREGIPEIVGDDERVGRLFAGEEPGDLARALLETFELARDPATPKACRARAELFSADRCVSAYETLLEQHARSVAR